MLGRLALFYLRALRWYDDLPECAKDLALHMLAHFLSG